MKRAISAILSLAVISLFIVALVGCGADIKAENEKLKAENEALQKQVEDLKTQLTKKKK